LVWGFCFCFCFFGFCTCKAGTLLFESPFCFLRQGLAM
jgi:hypothetical protein